MSGDALGRAGEVLARVGGELAAEVTVHEERLELTRFARNAIHQNVAESWTRLRLRLIGEDRVGVAEVRSGEPDAVDRLLAAAQRACRLAPPGPVTALPSANGACGGRTAFSQLTAEASPELRAEGVRVVAERARLRGLEAFGAYSTSCSTVAVASSLGVGRQATTTAAEFVAVVRGPDGAGYGDRFHPDVGRIDTDGLAEEVIETCARNQGARSIEPGDYEVVLGPYAVAEMVDHLSWVGFSALARQEGRSFMRFGERLLSDSVSIDDDASDPLRAPFPFDSEGVCTVPVSLIESGVCRGFVHDSATAARDGVASTGHALPMPNTIGPATRHLGMAAGDRSAEQLIAETERGLYVNRLWYVRSVHPLRTIITGMTREGTFLIERGRLGVPVRDLRFTQSIVEALADVRGLSRERSLHRAETEHPVLVPQLHLGRFTFTS